MRTDDRSLPARASRAVLLFALALPGCALSHLADLPEPGAVDSDTVAAPLPSSDDAAVPLDALVHDAGVDAALACPAEPLAPAKADVLWVLDASRAWSESAAAHASVRAAIADAATAWRAADHALSIFPGEVSGCDPDEHAVLEVGWGDPLAPALDEVTLTGPSEVAPALAGALASASTRAVRVPERAAVTVLVTHASPRSDDVACDDASREPLAEAASRAIAAGVRLYVLAISDDGALDAARHAPLRELAERTGGGAIVSTALDVADALGTLRARIESCTTHVARERAPARVEVRFEGGSTLAVERVAIPSGCHDGGYLVDERGDSALVTLCPAACELALELGEAHGAPRMVEAAPCAAE